MAQDFYIWISFKNACDINILFPDKLYITEFCINYYKGCLLSVLYDIPGKELPIFNKKNRVFWKVHFFKNVLGKSVHPKNHKNSRPVDFFDVKNVAVFVLKNGL